MAVVNQREVGEDTYSFSSALKHVLRQDPDVILVGEMRDLETISTALTAAETGHLVFATLHTQDTAQTIDRVIDVFPAHQQGQVRVQMSVALQGILTQQLLPTADGSGRVVACEVLVLDIADKRGSRAIELGFLKSVKASELAVFSRQLSTMITSGMSSLRALDVLEEQTESKFLKETIVAVRKDVEAGLALSEAMARHPKVFSPLFIAMTQAGEAGGVLENALMRVADQLEKDASLRRQIRSAMVYPTLVIVFAVGVMMALVAFLVPVFEGVFKQFGGELPALTKFSVLLSHAVTGYWWLIFGGAAAAIVGFVKWKNSSWGRPQWDHFRLRV